ncbi:3779_t:CDS:2 [Dentiscutata heterogama]|uniref:3779_t:CDS:1 n=1 Tax=Dentiscutata heterogama TaxID=1316150 RepID=A0ACA9KN78_9GLOM|nr:3779_t:CDS:2 [Dentiscutata heterogama]
MSSLMISLVSSNRRMGIHKDYIPKFYETHISFNEKKIFLFPEFLVIVILWIIVNDYAYELMKHIAAHSLEMRCDIENVEDLVKYIYKVVNNQTLYGSGKRAAWVQL